MTHVVEVVDKFTGFVVDRLPADDFDQAKQIAAGHRKMLAGLPPSLGDLDRPKNAGLQYEVRIV